MTARFALPVVALVLAFAAQPARAACSKFCDEAYDLGGSSADEPGAAPAHHHHTPIVEMSLPAYLWNKLREEAHAAADKTAFALITATSRLAVVAAREKQEHDATPAHAAPAAAPPRDAAHEQCPEAHGPPA